VSDTRYANTGELSIAWQSLGDGPIDVREDLARISVPTIVMHRTDDRVVPVGASRYIAAHVPGARLIELAGEDHLPFIGEVEPVLVAISTLLGAHGATDATPPGAPGNAATARPERPHATPPTAYAAYARPPRGSEPAVLERLLLGALDTEEPFQMGRFFVQRTLGSGGMGAVYLAEDRDLGRKVAIKVMHRSDGDAYRRFRREAMAVAQLSHPSVVQIYELGIDGSIPYLVMEYVPGGTVAELGDAPLPWRRATRLAASAARGLGAAHAVGIIHRDLKPANLLLPDRAGDHAKVADFGVAKLAGAESLTQEGAVIGTLGYLAPEQARGEPVDARADIWALGATWFRLLTGRRPFDGTAIEIIAATLAEVPVPDPRTFAPDITAEVAALVQRMCAYDREVRPAHGHAAADALEALLAT
jgi:Protein kinase domain